MLHFLAAALLLAGADDTPVTFAKPDMLMDPAELKKPAVYKKFVLLDARRKAEYLLGHAPGAQWIDHAAWHKAFNRGEKEVAWEAAIGKLGIDLNTPVVVYDNVQGKDAARIWWILKYWGVKDVRLLDGGWRGWAAAGGDVSRDASEPKPVKAELSVQTNRLTTMDELLKALKDKKLGLLIDARTAEEYCGEGASAARNGTIEGAKHLDWADLIDKKTGRFKTAKELQEVFKEAKIDPSKPATTFCQSGGRAAVMAFALEMMSGKEARNYYGSWSEWGNAPIEKNVPVFKPKPKPK